METTFLQHISLEMWFMFILGVVCIVLYSKMTIDRKEGVGRFYRATWTNFGFHLVASLIMLIGINELGEALIENYLTFLDSGGIYPLTLSSLIGMLGSRPVAWIVNKADSKFNIIKK